MIIVLMFTVWDGGIKVTACVVRFEMGTLCCEQKRLESQRKSRNEIFLLFIVYSCTMVPTKKWHGHETNQGI